MPSDFSVVAVFDTNAYLQLGRDRLRSLIELERNAAVFPLASAWTCLELLSKCTTPDPRVAGRSLRALRKIWEHTGYVDPKGPRIRLQEAGELTLIRGLFGINPEEPLQEGGFLGNMIVASLGMEASQFVTEFKDELAAIAARVGQEESTFLSPRPESQHPGPSKDELRQSLRGRATISILAAGLVQTLAEKYRIDLARIDSGLAVRKVVGNFGVAMHFMRDLLEDSLGTGIVPGGGNSAWDLKIAFHAGPGASVSGAPTLLVTDDERLHRAALAANEALRVLRMSEYATLVSDAQSVVQRRQRIVDPA